MSLTFTHFDLTGEGDFLQIFDLDTQALLYKLTGSTNPGTLNFNTGRLYLVFITDQQDNASGWEFTYTSSELTDINDPALAISASISPNPAHSELQVNVNRLNSTYSLRLLTTEGRLMYQENSTTITGNAVSRIDVSTFPRGIYVLHISTPDGTLYKKVVLN